MAQDINLGVLNVSGSVYEWSGAIQLEAEFFDSGTPWLRQFTLTILGIGSVQVSIRITATETGNIAESGPRFSQATERRTAFAQLTEDGGESILFGGPNSPGALFPDTSEPYEYVPPNGAFDGPLHDWVTGYNNMAVMLRLLDEAPLNAAADVALGVTGSAALTFGDAPAVAIDAAPDIEVRFAALTTELVLGTAPLILADFDRMGLDIVAFALLPASGTDTLYATSQRGGSDVPLDGDLELLETDPNSDITRLRWDGSVLLVNDNGGAVLEDYFQPGGPGSDLTMWFQTLDGTTSVPIATVYLGDNRAGGDFVNFGNFPAAMVTLLDSISAGSRFIMAFTRPLVPHDVGASADVNIGVTGSAVMALGGAPGHMVNVAADVRVDVVGAAALELVPLHTIAAAHDVNVGVTASATIGLGESRQIRFGRVRVDNLAYGSNLAEKVYQGRVLLIDRT